MLSKEGASLKLATMSHDHFDNQKVARTAYYAGGKRGMCRVRVLVSM